MLLTVVGCLKLYHADYSEKKKNGSLSFSNIRRPEYDTTIIQKDKTNLSANFWLTISCFNYCEQ
jgi:hypothetical protein